jgi:hypothetical protein
MSESDAEVSEVIEASPDVNDQLYYGLMTLMNVRSQIAFLQEQAKALTMQLEKVLPRTARFRDDSGVEWNATAVRPDDTVDVDLVALEAINPGLYEAVTHRALDRKALNRALRAGAVDAVAAQAMSLRPISPSIRLTPVEPIPEEDEL